jgi:hypothetical protein
MNKYLVFSHGFGVKKDSRGLFSDIAKAFPDYKPVMFNYNIISKSDNTVTVRTLHQQAELLLKQIKKITSKDPDAEIVVIAHSQGCVALALAKPKLKQAVLMTPPDNVSGKRVENYFSKYPGTSLEKDGTVRVPRKDGTVTRITKEFFKDITSVNALNEYSKLANNTPSIIIVAKDDEILRPVDFSSLPESVETLKINGDHNFTGQNRKLLIVTLRKIIQ